MCKNNDESIVIISFDEDNRTHAQLKSELKEAIDQIERGEFMGIDEVFERVIAQYAD